MSAKKPVTREIQIVFVFTIGEEFDPELWNHKLEVLADTIQDTAEISFDDDAKDTHYVDYERMTHLIIRRLVDGNEKEQVARLYNMIPEEAAA